MRVMAELGGRLNGLAGCEGGFGDSFTEIRGGQVEGTEGLRLRVRLSHCDRDFSELGTDLDSEWNLHIPRG
jgi:hypothetical protein